MTRSQLATLAPIVLVGAVALLVTRRAPVPPGALWFALGGSVVAWMLARFGS